MAADELPAPRLTEVDQAFEYWEACFNQHKQELRALKSPERQYQEERDGIQAHINEWWAAYDRMPHVQRELGIETERERLEQLVMQKSSLAAQHERTKEAQQAVYEQQQKVVFKRLCLAMKELAILGLSTGDPDDGTPDQPQDDQGQHHYSVQDSDSGAEENVMESTESNARNPEDANSEDQEPAPDPQSSPGQNEGQGDSATKHPLSDAQSPSHKRPRQTWTYDVSIQGKRTMTFHRVYQNSLAGDIETIVEYPVDSDLWYVIHCAEHRLKFTGLKPLHDAAQHLGSLDHGRLSRRYEDVIKHMGVQVLDCDKEQAKMNNAVAKNKPKSPVYNIETRSGGARGQRDQRGQRMREFERHSSRRSIFRHFDASSGRSPRPRGRSSGSQTGEILPQEQMWAPKGQQRLSRVSRQDGSPIRYKVQTCRVGSSRRQDSDTVPEPEPEPVPVPVPESQAGMGLMPGNVCLTYFGDNPMKTPVLILPFDNMASIGIEDDLKSLNLTAGRPKCCVYNRSVKKYQWAPGYEDGGRFVSKRRYPVLCLLSSALQKCPASWVEAAQLTVIDVDDTEWKLNDYNRQATEILRQLSKQKTALSGNSVTQDQEGNQGVNLPQEQTAQEQTGLQSGERSSRHNSPPRVEATTSTQMSPVNRSSAPTINRENNARSSGQHARAPSIEIISSSSSDAGSLPRNEAPLGKGIPESHLETIARDGLIQVPGDLGTVQGADSENIDPAAPLAAQQSGNSAAVSGTLPTHSVHPGTHQATQQGARYPVDAGTASKPQTQINAQPVPDHDTSIQGRIGEMFQGIERHMAEQQMTTYWLPQPLNSSHQTDPQSSVPQGPMNRTPSSTYPQIPSPSEANSHPPPYINTGQAGFEQPIYPSPISQNIPGPFPTSLPGIQTFSSQPQHQANHVALPPLMNSAGQQTRPPNNAIDSPITHHQDMTQSQPLDNSARDGSAMQHPGISEVWPHFAPGRLRDDLEHWARYYNCKPEMESLRRDNIGYFCPFCPPASAVRFNQAHELIHHLQKVHPTGFWVDPPVTTPPASQRGSL